MEILASVFIILAALVHIYIWVLESFLWTKPATMKTFNITSDLARASKALAFNQGFYNLFLAIITIIGFVLFIGNDLDSGKVLLFSSLGSMVLASIVLFASDKTKLRAALVQFSAPAIALVVLLLM